MNINEIWRNVIENLLEHISDSHFKIWLQETQLIQLQDNIGVIQIPNENMLDYIKEHYIGIIKETLSVYTGFPCVLKFTLNQDIKINTSQHEEEQDIFISLDPDKETSADTKQNLFISLDTQKKTLIDAKQNSFLDVKQDSFLDIDRKNQKDYEYNIPNIPSSLLQCRPQDIWSDDIEVEHEEKSKTQKIWPNIEVEYNEEKKINTLPYKQYKNDFLKKQKSQETKNRHMKIKDTMTKEVKESKTKTTSKSGKIFYESQSFFDFIDHAPQKSSRQSIKKPEKVLEIFPKAKLNPLYSFENFISGPSNEIAYATALSIANCLGDHYNPFLVYGSVGLGKTHLLQAICNRLIQTGCTKSIIYISCESFINEFISGIEENTLRAFREKYREVDVLIIDDIQFLSKKERTQDEFFHTFNALYNTKKQIIISCDTPVSIVPAIKDRLVSRFKWGIETQLLVPSFETRMAIVQKKAKLQNAKLPYNVCQYISDNIVTNMRELEGAVNHLIMSNKYLNREITLEFAKKALKDIIQFQEPATSLYEILEGVAHHFDIKMSDLQSQVRKQNIVMPRQIAIYLAKKMTQHSLKEIGAFFNRDHSTILHAIDKVETLQYTNESMSRSLQELEESILNK